MPYNPKNHYKITKHHPNSSPHPHYRHIGTNHTNIYRKQNKKSSPGGLLCLIPRYNAILRAVLRAAVRRAVLRAADNEHTVLTEFTTAVRRAVRRVAA